MPNKMVAVFAQEDRRRSRRWLWGLPYRRIEAHHLVYAAESAERIPRCPELPRVEKALLRIPGDEPAGAFQRQSGAFVQLVLLAIFAEPSDLLEVLGGAVVLNAAIGAPDAEHVFDSRYDRWAGGFGRMCHEVWLLSITTPYRAASPPSGPMFCWRLRTG